MTSENVIEISNLSKCYQIYEKPQHRLLQMFARGRKKFFREFWALRDVSFTIKKGETIGIIGRNGSGKSTLLQMICGTLNPTHGDIKVRGRIAALLELGSGFNPEFTGRENVYLSAALYGLTREQIDARFEKIIAFADIGEHLEQPVKTYSSGMFVRLAFAVIAHVDADILIIDEALSVGDAFFQQKCMRYLREFMNNGTLLFVSHDTGAILSLTDRAILLNSGQLVADGKPKDVIELYLQKLYESMQGESITSTAPQTATANTAAHPQRDMRLDFVNTSNLRNDIEIFPFNSEARSFGKGGAEIIHTALLDEQEHPLSWAVGGETVILSITCRAKEKLSAPIIGFNVKNRLGQSIFVDNTFLTYRMNPVTVETGRSLEARFKFIMPVLPQGDYAIDVAIAEGTQESHIQHHWVHEALAFKSQTSMVCFGLFGVSMQEISIKQI